MSEAVTAPSGQQRTCKGCGETFSADLATCPKCGVAYSDEPPAAGDSTGPAAVLPAAAAPKNLDIGETLLGQWKLESKIGEGGMGNVFLATELKLGRKVAVKALHTDNLQEETVKRFEREAQVMGKLDHPNIVTLYAVGRHRDVPFLVMRYLEGGSLWDLLDANGGRLAPEQLLPLVKQLCSALGYIHGKNLIHRDLKPSNIFISPQGKVTLLDLGLARGHTTALTRTGVIWGTPDFMAPEQIVGEKQLDGRADLYALTVVLYRMIANQPPFPDTDEQDLMRAHLTRPRPDISKAWFQATPALALCLQKGMAIKPEERFQTAEELAQAFDRVVNSREQSTRAQPSAPPPSAPRTTTSEKPAVVAPLPVPRTSTGEKPAVVAPLPVPRTSTTEKPLVAPPVPSAPKASTGLGVAHTPTAAAKPLPPPPAAPPPAPPAPPAPPPPAKPVTSQVTAHVPKATAAAKGKVIDELDDDATELGELPPELMAAIHGVGEREADTGQSSAITPVDPAPAVARAEAKKAEAAAPVPRKSVSAPPKSTAATVADKPAAIPSKSTPGTVPDKPGVTRGSGASTAPDRPGLVRPAPAAPDDDAALTRPAGYIPSGQPDGVLTHPAGYVASLQSDGALTRPAGQYALPNPAEDEHVPSDDDTRPPGFTFDKPAGEPVTGPSPVEPEPLASGPSGPMMVRTADIEPDDDDADMKTVVGNLDEAISALSTGIVASPAPLPAEPASVQEPEPTTAMPPPPKVSAPRQSRTNLPKRNTSTIQAQGRKEPTGVRGKAPAPADEASPPWMHPYVLVTGGLLLLALGFLIGVLLR